MTDLLGTSTDSSWPRRLVRELTALEEELAQLSWMKTIELPVVGITAPTLVVLVVWLGSVLGAPLGLSLAVATILGLALVTPFMMREMQFFTPTDPVDTLCTAPTNPVTGVGSLFEAPDSEGWYGPMANSLSDLTAGQLELIGDLLGTYQETEDLTQVEWAEVQAAMDIVEIRLEEL